MPIPDENKIPRAVKNEWFYLIARVCMILSVPIGGFFMQRALAKADEISSQLSAQNVDLRLLTTRVEFQMKNDADKLSDHEIRLRQIERTK